MITVCHLTTTCMTRHGPSEGILAQIRFHRPDRVRSSVWSLYPAPPGRAPDGALAEAGAAHHAFGMRGFLDLRVLWPLVRRLRAARPDVLHCHLLRANLYGRVAARLAGVPVAISTHRSVEAYFSGRDAASRAVRAAERRTAGLVARHVAVSEGVRQAVIRDLGVPPGQVTTVLNAVDLSAFAPHPLARPELRRSLGLRPDAVVVGSVGWLDARKNYHLLVRVTQALRDGGHDVQMVVFGEGPERGALERAVAESGLQGRVFFMGFRADVPALLSALDVFALTSLAEGLPRALMEAMAAGLPCVATDVGGNPEAVVDGVTGFIRRADDFDGYAGALERLVASADLRERFGEAGRARAQATFSAARIAREYEDLYRELLGGAGREPSQETT